MKYATEIDFSFNNTMTIFIDNIKENSVVLEFGPANGSTLMLDLKKMKKIAVAGISADDIGIQCGLEDKKDLIADIAQALEAI